MERVCDILNLLASSADPTPLVAVAKAVDLPKSSAFRYLVTLEGRNYVERDPLTGDYRLGPGIVPLQAQRLEQLVQRARPYLERLRDELGETINLGRLHGARVVYLDIVESDRMMRLSARPGTRDYLHSTALGKAIAAVLPEDRVAALLQAEGMPSVTERTITDQDAFFRELAKVRRIGYALDDRENEPGGRCVAVSFPSWPDTGLSLSAPAARFPRDEVADVAGRLRQVAVELSGGGL